MSYLTAYTVVYYCRCRYTAQFHLKYLSFSSHPVSRQWRKQEEGSPVLLEVLLLLLLCQQED